jgi:parallel beta-helix repeat protein
MVDGTISGNTAEKSGGGLYIAAYVKYINYNPVASGGTVTMSGGTISGNTAKVTSTQNVAGTPVVSGDGGGVYLADYGTGTGSAPIPSASTFSMTSNGTISGNTAKKSGGGLYIAESSTFTKSGGTIYGSNATSPLKNTASANKGAAVYINNSAGTNVENTIQNNYSYTPQ